MFAGPATVRPPEKNVADAGGSRSAEEGCRGDFASPAEEWRRDSTVEGRQHGARTLLRGRRRRKHGRWGAALGLPGGATRARELRRVPLAVGVVGVRVETRGAVAVAPRRRDATRGRFGAGSGGALVVAARGLGAAVGVGRGRGGRAGGERGGIGAEVRGWDLGAGTAGSGVRRRVGTGSAGLAVLWRSGRGG